MEHSDAQQFYQYEYYFAFCCKIKLFRVNNNLTISILFIKFTLTTGLINNELVDSFIYFYKIRKTKYSMHITYKENSSLIIINSNETKCWFAMLNSELNNKINCKMIKI